MQLSPDPSNFKIKNFSFSSSFSSTAAIDQYFVCFQKSNVAIDQFNSGCERNAVATQFNESASKSNLANKKIGNSNALAASPTTAAEVAAAEMTTNEMETLYWETHGSLLWQHWYDTVPTFYTNLCTQRYAGTNCFLSDIHYCT